MEILIEVLGEFLLQIILEALVELGLHSMKAPFKKPLSPWLAAIGYGIFGAMAGAVSLWIAPSHFIDAGPLRVINLVATPLAAGVVMAAIGAWRAQKGQALLRLDRFSYGFLFALSVALVRFVYSDSLAVHQAP